MSIAAHRTEDGLSPPGFLIFSGANDRAVLALCRGFNQHRIPFGLIGRGRDDLLLRSRYAKHYVHNRFSAQIHLEDLLKARTQGNIRYGKRPWVVCPTSEYVNLALFEHREFLDSEGIMLATCDERLYLQLTNKETFRYYAGQLGVMPPSKIEGSANDASLPFVAKPIRNLSHTNKILYPHLIRTEQERNHFLTSADPAEFYLEEFVRGESWYLLFHVGANGVVTHGAQRNFLQQGKGKSIVLAQSMRYPEQNVVSRFIHALQRDGYRGFIMVELRRDAEGHVVAIEANPRCWGPFQLTIDAHMGLLEAFLCDRGYEVEVPSNRRTITYAWLGGVCKALRNGTGLDCHASGSTVFGAALPAVGNDVFARCDAYRSFLFDLCRT